jgi:glycine dehydrogenase subunit 1
MHRYIPNTDSEAKEMLERIGVTSVDQLFRDIPDSLKLNRPLQLNASLTEPEIVQRMHELGMKNKDVSELTCFLGAGAYDHYIPTIIKHIAARSEFLTAYTPYQPEISQGTLQVIFEYQSMICTLTGMDVSNASLYDGPTAAVEAAIMAAESTRRSTILVSETVDPEVRKVLKSYMHFREIRVVEIPMEDGTTDVEQLKATIDGDTAALIVQSPNFFGIIEDFKEMEPIVHDNKSMLIQYADPISLAILKKPGEIGADIAVGEAQGLGNSLSFGGPYIGYLASSSKLMRKMPGRIVGQSLDIEGKRAFVLTMQAREQHIRRYKATSNICSNQNLNALIASAYMVTMGKEGLKEVATQSTQKAHYAAERITAKGKYHLAFQKPFFKEFAIIGQRDTEQVNAGLLKEGILGGYDLGKPYQQLANSMLLCVTEKRTKEEIDRLAGLLEVLG